MSWFPAWNPSRGVSKDWAKEVAWALGDSGLGLERDRTLANQIQELRGTSLPPTKQPSGISKSIWNQRGLQEIRVVNLD